MKNLTDTIVALSTPQGEGAIGVIRLSGSEAISICDKVFNGKKLVNQATHTAHFGTIKNEQNQIVDEVLVTIFKNPKSYTGEDICEVSCHGSSYIIQQILQLFIRQGARTAQAGEFTLRAFMNGKMDLSQAEAVADLIASESASSHTIAMNQMRGGISNKIKELRQELIDFAALIELELDFGEEDVEFADREKLVDLIHRLQKQIRILLDSFNYGNAIKKGVPVAIVGKPNVGKSSMLNALTDEDRAIVSEIAGTTRDVIEETITIDGIQFRFMDTAGIRKTTDKIESIGIEKSLESISKAEIIIYMFDFEEETPTTMFTNLSLWKEDKAKTIVVVNKCESMKEGGGHQISNNVGALEFPNFLYLSLLGDRKESSVNAIKRELLKVFNLKGFDSQKTVISNARHYNALEGAYTSLQQALDNLSMGISGDFVAMDIRHSLQYLGEITGEISSDDLLDSIFSRFCIGK